MQNFDFLEQIPDAGAVFGSDLEHRLETELMELRRIALPRAIIRLVDDQNDGLVETPDGGRNELSLKNDFSVLVTRTSPPPPEIVSTNAPAKVVQPLRSPKAQGQP